MIGKPTGVTEGLSVSHIPHEPGQWYIDSGMEHRTSVSLSATHLHFFLSFPGDITHVVMVNLSNDEKSSQHVPHILGQ